MTYENLFHYDEKTHTATSSDPEIVPIGTSGFGRGKGRSWLFEVRGKRRGISMTIDYVPCEHGKGMILEDRVPRKYCLHWKNVMLIGRAEFKNDKQWTRLSSEPFESEKERQDFIRIAIAFLQEFRFLGTPVAKISFEDAEKIPPISVKDT